MTKLIEFDDQFKELHQHLDRHDQKFAEHDGQLDLLAQTVAEHTQRLDSIDQKLDAVATKEDVSKIMNVLDEVVGLYKKKDEELTQVVHGLRQLDDRVVIIEKDVAQIKPILGLT